MPREAQFATTANFRDDVDLSGSPSVSDAIVVYAAQGHTLPPP
jgi:hypothetical protein